MENGIFMLIITVFIIGMTWVNILIMKRTRRFHDDTVDSVSSIKESVKAILKYWPEKIQNMWRVFSEHGVMVNSYELKI